MKDDNKLDDLLKQVGTGRWNFVYFFGAAFWYMLIPPQTLSVVYLAPSLNYTCLPPLGQNVSHLSQDSCSYFRHTSEGLTEEDCTNWEYDNTTFSSTLTSEFNLVCGRAHLRATYQSIYTLSSIIGSLVSGFMADRYGRKKVVVVSQMLYAATCIGLGFVTSFNMILALRFFLGAVGTPTLYILGMEVCETKWRSVVGITMALPWAFGMMLWGGAGYLVRDWRWLQMMVSLPTLVIFPLFFLIDESPRWLIVTGRHEQAIRVLRRASRINRTTLPPNEILRPMIKDIQAENEKPILKKEPLPPTGKKNTQGRCAFSWPKLLSTQKIRTVIFALAIVLFISSLVYCGLSLSGTTYSNDPFLYMVLSGVMEIPSYSLTALIVKKWGRKFPSMIGYAICGVVILSLAFIPSNITWLVMTFAMLGKLCISGAFMILLLFETELLPTEVRVQGLAVTILSANVGASISAYIAGFLSPLVPWLPSVIFGVSSFIATVLIFPLPETLGQPLPDTMDDLDTLWRVVKGKKKKHPEDAAQMEKLTAQC